MCFLHGIVGCGLGSWSLGKCCNLSKDKQLWRTLWSGLCKKEAVFSSNVFMDRIQVATINQTLLFRFSTLGLKLVNSLSEIKKQLWLVGVECGIGCGMWSTVPPTAWVKKLLPPYSRTGFLWEDLVTWYLSPISPRQMNKLCWFRTRSYHIFYSNLDLQRTDNSRFRFC